VAVVPRPGEDDDRHLPDPPDVRDPATLERGERRVDGLQRHHARRQRRLDPRIAERRAQAAGGDLDLGQLGHAPKPRLAGTKCPHPPTRIRSSSFTRAHGPGEHRSRRRSGGRASHTPMHQLPTLQAPPPEGLTPDDVRRLSEEVRALAAERNAVILAHNYQVPEIQDVADLTGDSLQLSREAAATEADVIAFCGVHFMAETASVLSPDKTVLIPDPDAGCSLSDSITADQLRAWKAEHPGALVVMYVNTAAEVKAETDYCCTSSNAVSVIEHVWRE